MNVEDKDKLPGPVAHAYSTGYRDGYTDSLEVAVKNLVKAGYDESAALLAKVWVQAQMVDTSDIVEKFSK